MNARRNVGSSSAPNLFSTPEARIAESNRRLMEEQNNKKTSALAESVEKLKLLSIDINDEVSDQNRLLNSMGNQMGSASSMLNDTLGKLGVMLESSESKHALYLIIFVVVSFVLLYTYFFKLPSSGER